MGCDIHRQAARAGLDHPNNLVAAASSRVTSQPTLFWAVLKGMDAIPLGPEGTTSRVTRQRTLFLAVLKGTNRGHIVLEAASSRVTMPYIGDKSGSKYILQSREDVEPRNKFLLQLPEDFPPRSEYLLQL